MSVDSSRGPEVPAHEDLLRGIICANWWDAEEKHLSSAIFGFEKFSAYIESMTSVSAQAAQLRAGSGMIRFSCGAARALAFDARHEPEGGDESHSNVYCDLNSRQRKKRARSLVQVSAVLIEPTFPTA